METFVTWLEPQPLELPARMNSPFDVGAPTAVVQTALDSLMGALREGVIAPGRSTDLLYGPEGGKMFGVLVVRAPDGRVGWLRAFSGQLGQAWDVEGYVPPVFERALRASVEPAGERAVKALTAKVEAHRQTTDRPSIERALNELVDRQAAALAALKHLHEEQRRRRHLERARLETEGLATATAMKSLDRASQADDVELRAAKKAWSVERAELEAALRRDERRRVALERLRRIVSQVVSWQLYDTYVFENARGVRRSLRSLFEPAIPSSGTGDCAAPKLLVFARRHGLVPLGLAECWWGAPPPGGGRVEGALYPACKDKCGPLLPFLLDGVDVAPSRRHRPRDFESDDLRVLHRDERVLVIDKPHGLLSVPGTDTSVTDSVLARVRKAFPSATGPLLVHRLDLETSGVLLIALDEPAYVALQAQFTERTVEKRYVAVLEGVVVPDRGVIELPLRVDLEQRPRQVVDFEHGKPAVTRFEVLARSNGRTRIAFQPETGRTHQLRVHAAHGRGLGTPIVGDLLYGRPERRLHLHAERLSFTHPATNARLTIESPAPF
jgi:tRNA pseudouridine32 synthase/23S rRNA pseudouridine746 synthase